MTPEQLDALRASSCPQPSAGGVPRDFFLSILRPPHNHLASAPPVPLFAFWDSPQTADFICATDDPELALELLQLEAAQEGAAWRLIHGERETDIAPPRPTLSIPFPIITLGDLT